jgi:hypothetical protein
MPYYCETEILVQGGGIRLLAGSVHRANGAYAMRPRARHLILLSIAFDPKADPRLWHFPTGPLPEVRTGHHTHVLVIDREGELAANFEDNGFRAEQPGDFVVAVLDRTR